MNLFANLLGWFFTHFIFHHLFNSYSEIIPFFSLQCCQTVRGFNNARITEAMIIFDICWGIWVAIFLSTDSKKKKKRFPRLRHRPSKSTTVTKDLLSKKENGIGHGFAAIPAHNWLRHIALDVAPQVPAAGYFWVFFFSDTISAAPYETTQHMGENDLFPEKWPECSVPKCNDGPSATDLEISVCVFLFLREKHAVHLWLGHGRELETWTRGGCSKHLHILLVIIL